MKRFARHVHLRRLVSIVLAVALTSSMVVVPAGAYQPALGDQLSIAPGTTNLTLLGDVTEASNGINGVASIEVTGSLATRTRLEASRTALADSQTLYACGVRTFNKFRVWYGTQGQAAVATTITGLTTTTTVGQFRAKVEAQVPSVATSIETTSNRLYLTSRVYGRCAIAVTDGDIARGIGPIIFGKALTGQLDALGRPLGTATTSWGRTFSGGAGYDGSYFGGGTPLTLPVSFLADPGVDYEIGAALPGTLNGSGAFVAQKNQLGLYTAVKLPGGYDIVLSTADGAPIAGGTATVQLAGGERDPMRPDFEVSCNPNPVESGQSTTITATFRGMPESAGEGAIDEATFTLPDGFVPSGTDADAVVGATPAVVAVDPGTRTISVSGFAATEDTPLVVTVASQVPTTPGEYSVTGTYSNIQDAGTHSVAAVGKIRVVELDIQVTASPALEGDDAYGHAMVGGNREVTFEVRTNIPKAGQVIEAAAATALGEGTLNAMTAVTDASGLATFTVRSYDPTLDGDTLKYGRYFKQFTFTCQSDPSVTASGYATFYTYEITAAMASRTMAFADGQDAITYYFSAKDPVTGDPAPAGTRVYFAAGGDDRFDTVLAPSSARCDENGYAAVNVTRGEVTSMDVTGTAGLVWVAANTRDDSSRFALDGGPPAGVPGVQFFDYLATAAGTVTAQQSARGAAARQDYVIKNAAGDVLEYTMLDSVQEATSTDVLKTAPLTVETIDGKMRLGAEVKADEPGTVRRAGDVVQAGLVGRATTTGVFGSQDPITFGVDMPIHIVNNATVTALGSIYLGKANITASGLKPGTPSIRAMSNTTAYTLTGTTIGVDLDGTARPQSFDLPVTMLKGTYDLVIDGITFPGALVVGDGIAIGVNKVVITLGASRGIYPNYATRGSAVNVFGVVTTTGNVNVPTSIVNVYSSATPDGADPTFIGQVLTSNGQFGYRVVADKGRYYFATTEPNSQYAAGDSRAMHGAPLFVGVKTYATLKVTSAPLSARVNTDFVVKGSLPKHSYDTTVVVRAFKLVNRRWVLKASYSTAVPAGATTFVRPIKITSRGSWALGVAHADYDHLSSTSRYRYLAIK